MNVAISAVGIHHRDGAARHLYQLLRHLVIGDRETTYRVYLTNKHMEVLADLRSANNFEWIVVPRPFLGPFANMAWNYVVLYRAAKQSRIDAIHFAEMNRCFLPRCCPTIVTVHGLIALSVKNKDGRLRGMYHKRIMPLALRRATCLVASSENTKQDLIRRIGIPAQHISVIPVGCTVWPVGDTELAEAANGQLREVQKPYLLCVARLEHPNKNHVRLLEAFRRLLSADESRLHLVLAGQEGWRYEMIRRAIESSGLGERVIVTGYVSDLELKCLYTGARGVVVPSLYEGFGIPVIEAMSLGVPVACSNTSSLREVGEGAVLMFNPENVEEIVKALRELLWNEDTRRTLVSKGFTVTGKYEWNAIAAKTVALYKTVARRT